MNASAVLGCAAVAALAVSAVFLWRRLGGLDARKKLIYMLVPAAQAAIVVYAEVAAGVYADAAVVSLAISVLGIAQAALDPLLARGLATAESADEAASLAVAAQEQLAAQQSHLERSRAGQAELDARRAQLHARFAQVAGLLEAGDFDAARAALDSAEQAIPARGSHLCRNAAVDALLQSKLAACADAKITLDLRIGLGEDLCVPHLEVCAILGNLIDNAMNACAALPAGSDRTITAAARQERALLVIKVQNTCVPGAAAKPARRRAAGLDLANLPAHGWGTGIVAAVAARHNGTFETQQADGRFTDVVTIPTA